MEQKTPLLKRPVAKYTLLTYIIFWCGLIATLGVALLAGMTSPAVTVCSDIIAWTPTFVVLVWFKSLLPEKKRGAWLKEKFTGKISIPLMLITFIVTCATAFGALFIYEGFDPNRLKSLLTPSKLAVVALSVLVSGATGEELGWRGFLQTAIEEKNGGKVIRAALIVGIIWSFWHTPLWFVSVGLPMDILPFYIISFIIANIAFSVIIAVCYHYSRNIIIPMWIHFCFNFTSNIIIKGYDMQTQQADFVKWFCILAALSAAAAVIFALCHLIKQRKIKKA